jgi:hypothetical protein
MNFADNVGANKKTIWVFLPSSPPKYKGHSARFLVSKFTELLIILEDLVPHFYGAEINTLMDKHRQIS